jgi:hypothetical protein
MGHLYHSYQIFTPLCLKDISHYSQGLIFLKKKKRKVDQSIKSRSVTKVKSLGTKRKDSSYYTYISRIKTQTHWFQ